MVERSEEQTRERSVGVDADAVDVDLAERAEVDGDTPDRGVGGESTGRLGRLRRRFGSIFSVRSFLLSLLTTVVGAITFGFVIPFFGSLAALGGVFAVAFAFGALGSRRRYLEVGLAGAVTAALGTLTEFLVVTLVGESQLLVVFGAGSGLLAALAGHYFGRDLRSGMTRNV
ncbi:hypothetical protein [Halorhabdus rudnickae]|uniref:hypothetical protein n=1 Tax=Halorhabdus rudnickae TaxID=1775544 RepID=UPI0010835A0B|nr:hypothetical protein [Halorhabdus rudnickae]